MRKYKPRTEEQKAKRREYIAANKEEISARTKVWKEANKEKLAIQNAAWREANKDKVVAQQKIRSKRYAELNKELVSLNAKAYRESKKDGYFTVYYLTEEHYVGQTTALHLRLTNHRKDHKRHILDAEVLGKFETRKEALAFEAKLHDMGYHGKNNGL